MKRWFIALLSLGLCAWSPLYKLEIPEDYGCRSCSQISRQMAWSLDHEGWLWHTDGYRVSRDGGGAIWVANDAYGVSIGPTPESVGNSALSDENERDMLYRAYERWLNRASGGQFSGKK